MLSGHVYPEQFIGNNQITKGVITSRKIHDAQNDLSKRFSTHFEAVFILEMQF